MNEGEPAVNEVEGHCDARFNSVKDAFAQNFRLHGEVGASVAAMIDGRMVVDLWAGDADGARTRPWERDTIVNVYSTTKGMVAVCAHRLVEQGRLDVDAPVARYWPEFAQAGKELLPVRYLLCHKAGLPAIRERLPLGTLYNWDAMAAALAAESPWWEPGTKHGYHAVTFGFLVGEVIRRVSGKSVGAYFRDEIATPLGLDFHIGLAAEHDARTAEMLSAPPPEPGSEQHRVLSEVFGNPESLTVKALTNPPDLVIPGAVNTRQWRAAEIPASNGHGNARALARFYGALARGGTLDNVHVLKEETIEAAIVEQASGIDEVLRVPSRFGLGLALTRPNLRFGYGPRGFGHTGMGGSIGFADPDAKIGFGYAMNQMITTIGGTSDEDPRWPPLFDALYGCL
jgi:CubicO group peptidase (beta-lactamase class C family)